MRASPSYPKHIPKTPPPTTITLGITVSTYEFWEDTNSQTISLALTVPFSSIFPLKLLAVPSHLIAPLPLLNFSLLVHFSLNFDPLSLASGFCPTSWDVNLIGSMYFLAVWGSLQVHVFNCIKYPRYFKVFQLISNKHDSSFPSPVLFFSRVFSIIKPIVQGNWKLSVTLQLSSHADLTYPWVSFSCSTSI